MTDLLILFAVPDGWSCVKMPPTATTLNIRRTWETANPDTLPAHLFRSQKRMAQSINC